MLCYHCLCHNSVGKGHTNFLASYTHTHTTTGHVFSKWLVSDNTRHLSIILSMPAVWRWETIALPPEEAITMSLPSCRCLSRIQRSKQVLHKPSEPSSQCFFKESILATAIFRAGLQKRLCEHNHTKWWRVPTLQVYYSKKGMCFQLAM